METERLVLRAHRVEDFPRCAALWSDPVVIRYIGGIPLTPEDVWKRLLQYAGHWLLLGFGYWVVEEKVTGNFLGEVGFADLKRAIEPPLGNSPEAGWVFASSAHGKGFATEAVQAIHIWGANHFQTANSCVPDRSRKRTFYSPGCKDGIPGSSQERLQGTTCGHFLPELEQNLTAAPNFSGVKWTPPRQDLGATKSLRKNKAVEPDA